MADKALSYVRDKGYRVLKVKVGADVNGVLIRALMLIRRLSARTSACAWTRTRSYDVPTALKALNAFAALGVESVEQCLPAWNMEAQPTCAGKRPPSI